MNGILTQKFAYSRRHTLKKKENSCCSDAVSRIASDIAAKAAFEARTVDCGRCSFLNQKACLAQQELAEKSLEAAKMAQSNLASKLALVNKLTEEKQTVSYILKQLIRSREQLELAINKEIESIATAEALREVLKKALRMASEVAVRTDMVLAGVNHNIGTVDTILGLENEQCHMLCQKEQKARLDVEVTRIAEKKAVLSATHARKNVFKMERQSLIED